jgi:hypothetical protein
MWVDPREQCYMPPYANGSLIYDAPTTIKLDRMDEYRDVTR